MAICLALAAFAQAHDVDTDRYYFDARQGHTPGLYIQLIRPWMNAERNADWRTTRWKRDLPHNEDDVFTSNVIEWFVMVDSSGGRWASVGLIYRGGPLYGWRWVAVIGSGDFECTLSKLQDDPNRPALTADQTKAYVEGALDALRYGRACPTAAALPEQPDVGATIEPVEPMREALRLQLGRMLQASTIRSEVP